MLLAVTGDRVGPDHHVDLTRLQRRFPLARIDHPQIGCGPDRRRCGARSRGRCRCRSPPAGPIDGFRKPNRYVFWSTPTMSRPRSAIAAIVEPGGMAPGAGSGPGRRLASRSQSAFPATGAVVTSLRTGRPRLDRRDRHRAPAPARTTSGGGERKCRAAPSQLVFSQELLEPRPQPDDSRRRSDHHQHERPRRTPRQPCAGRGHPSRSVARVCSISSRRLDSTAANCAAEASGSVPIACATAAG